MMSRIFKVIVSVVGLSLLFSSCLFDPSAIFGAGSPNKRHEASLLLPTPTAPVPANLDSFSLIVITDPHYGRETGALLAAESLQQTTPYDFLIINGDLTQASLPEEWDSMALERTQLSVPSFATIGNHDIFNNGEEQFYAEFGPSHYSFQVGDVLFVFLDTGNGVIARDQKKWYEEVLATSSASKILTFTHYSPITRYVQHMVTLPKPEEFYWMVDINADYGVTAMISGHLHNNLTETFRGVQYISQTNTADERNPQALHIVYQNGELSFTRLALPY